MTTTLVAGDEPRRVPWRVNRSTAGFGTAWTLGVNATAAVTTLRSTRNNAADAVQAPPEAEPDERALVSRRWAQDWDSSAAPSP